MKARKTEERPFARLRERGRARTGWEDLEHDDDGWLGRLTADVATSDAEEASWDRANEPTVPIPKPRRENVLVEDPLRRASPLREPSLTLHFEHQSLEEKRALDGELNAHPPLNRATARRLKPSDLAGSQDDEDVASDVAATVQRAYAAIDTARSELDRASAWAEKAKALQLSEQQIGQLLLGAKQTAAKAIADAEERAAAIVSGAEAQAKRIIVAAEVRASQLVSQAEAKCEELVADGELRNRRAVADAAASGADTATELAEQRRAILEEATVEAARIVAEARNVVRTEDPVPDGGSSQAGNVAPSLKASDVENVLGTFAETNTRLADEISALINALSMRAPDAPRRHTDPPATSPTAG